MCTNHDIVPVINACAAAMHGFLLAGDGGLLGGNFSEVQAAEHVH